MIAWSHSTTPNLGPAPGFTWQTIASSMQHAAAALGLADPRRAEDESEHILEQLNHPSDSLKLGSGFIPDAWRDKEGLGRAIRHVSRVESTNLVDYATQRGSSALCAHLLHRVAQLGIEAQPSQILLTQGASQALDLLIRYILKPGDTMFVEDPGYYSLYGLLKLHGVNLVGIPRTHTGPDLDVLQAQLKRHRPSFSSSTRCFTTRRVRPSHRRSLSACWRWHARTE